MLVVLRLGSCRTSLSHSKDTWLGWARTSQLRLAGFPSQVYTATEPLILGESEEDHVQENNNHVSREERKHAQSAAAVGSR